MKRRSCSPHLTIYLAYRVLSGVVASDATAAAVTSLVHRGAGLDDLHGLLEADQDRAEATCRPVPASAWRRCWPEWSAGMIRMLAGPQRRQKDRAPSSGRSSGRRWPASRRHIRNRPCAGPGPCTASRMRTAFSRGGLPKLEKESRATRGSWPRWRAIAARLHGEIGELLGARQFMHVGVGEQHGAAAGDQDGEAHQGLTGRVGRSPAMASSRQT